MSDQVGAARAVRSERVKGRPEQDEAAPYYFGYIDKVSGDDVVAALEKQLEETLTFFFAISEEKSLYRYAPEKWSIREVLNHLNDCERLFLARAFWFARGFETPLPSFDQMIAAGTARADERSWASHVEEFRAVRNSTLAFFQNLPAEAWTRAGIASGNPFSVRALAYLAVGHVTHHTTLLQQRYL